MSGIESWWLLLGSLILFMLGLIGILYRKEISRWYYQESIFKFTQPTAITPRNERLVHLQTALGGVVMVINGVFGVVYVLNGGNGIRRMIFIPLIIAIIGSVLAGAFVGLLAFLKR